MIKLRQLRFNLSHKPELLQACLSLLHTKDFISYQDSVLLATETTALAYELQDTTAEITGLSYLAEVQSQVGEWHEAFKSVRRALELADSGDIASEAKGTLILGTLYSNIGEHDKALDILNYTLSLGANAKIVLWHMGQVYLKRAMYPEALLRLEQADGLSHPEDVRLAGMIKSSIALCKHSMNQSAEAIAYINSALQTLWAHHYQTHHMMNTKGFIQLNMGEYDFAIHACKESLTINYKAQRIAQDWQAEYHAYLCIARAYIAKERPSNALDNALKALDVAQLHQARTMIAESHDVLHLIYKNIDQPEKEVHHYKEYQHIQAQLIQEKLKLKQESIQDMIR